MDKQGDSGENRREKKMETEQTHGGRKNKIQTDPQRDQITLQS